MTLDPTFLLTAFVTLFVIIDPVGLTPLFLTLTQGLDAAHRRRIALRACGVAAILLTLFGLAGENLLGAIGISVPAFRIAGGVLLFLTALDMLFERRTRRREDKTQPTDDGPAGADDPSVFPLAMPLLAGPGAIASMILLTGQASGDWQTIAAIHGVMLAVLILAFVMLLAATPVERVLGRTGTLVVTRLFGMLLAALAVQFIIDGIIGTGLAG